MDANKPDEKPSEKTLRVQPDKIKQKISPVKTSQQSSVSQNSSNSRVQNLLPDTIHREDWLLKQHGNYTIRLLGTFKEKVVTTYLNENIIGNKFGHELSYHLTEKDGKYKHTLLYGIFSTYSQAKGAIKNLPKNLKSNGPWPVKLDDIKKSITLYRESKLVNIEKTTPKNIPATKQAKIVAVKAANDDNISGENKGTHNESNAFPKEKHSESFTVQLLRTSSKNPLLSYMKSSQAALISKINENGDWNDEIEAELKAAIEDFKANHAF